MLVFARRSEALSNAAISEGVNNGFDPRSIQIVSTAMIVADLSPKESAFIMVMRVFLSAFTRRGIGCPARYYILQLVRLQVVRRTIVNEATS